MKKYRLFFILIIVCCAAALTACIRTEMLATPTSVVADRETRMLTWDEVPYATGGYRIDINGRIYTAEFNEFSLSSLRAAGTYVIMVQAVTADRNYFRDSEWSNPVLYEVEDPGRGSGLVFNAINFGMEYEVSGMGSAGANVEVPEFFGDRPVTRIGAAAFSGVSRMTSIIIPDSITSIGRRAFHNNINLESITLGNGLLSIGEGAFQGCRNLRTIVLPEGLQSIGVSAFASAHSLEHISIPDSVTYIGERAFANCSNLTSVIIGNGLTRIDNAVFLNCPSLISITIGNSVASIGEGAFFGAISLVNITIPRNVTTIEDDAFYNSGFWNNATGIVFVDDWVVGSRYRNIERIDLRPGTVGIADFAFWGLTYLESISIPESVANIGILAFMHTQIWVAMAPNSLVFADNWLVGNRNNQITTASVTRTGIVPVGISDGVFSNHPRLETVYIPSTIRHIGRAAFFNNSSLRSIVIPDGVKNIADYTFYRCVALISVEIPDSITHIGRAAFFGCSSLSEITIPSGVTKIKDYTFYGCSSLTSIVIPASVISIGDSAFRNCTFRFFGLYIRGLSAVIFEEGSQLKTIGNNAFRENGLLSEIILPDSLKTIGNHAFRGASFLESVLIGNNVTTIGDYAFYDNFSLRDIVLGESVKSIGEYAFFNSVRLTNIIIPSSVERIGNYAFFASSLLSIVIPKSVVHIGSHVFSLCNYLTIFSEATECQHNWSVHWNSSSRPVFWGSTISADNSYVVSFVKDRTSIFMPDSGELARLGLFRERDGYVFGGWALTDGGEVEYTMEDIEDVSYGIELWAVWIKLQIHTYTFILKTGEEEPIVYEITAYIVFFAPRLSPPSGFIIEGWFISEAFLGTPVRFPYYSIDGTEVILFAKTTLINDGL